MDSSKISLCIFIISFIYFLSEGTDISLLVILIVASICYFLIIKDPENAEKYRYADWTITTPLMLYNILNNKLPLTTNLGLILAVLLMIGTRVMGMKSNANAWFLTGCILFLPIAYTLYNLKQNKPAIYLTLFIWSLYPFVWIMHKDNLINTNHTDISYSIMDVVSKVGLIDLLLLAPA